MRFVTGAIAILGICLAVAACGGGGSKPTVITFDGKFENLLFEKDSSQLKPEARKYVLDYPNVSAIAKGFRIDVKGHTDDTGKALTKEGRAEYNMKLSQARADEIAKFLVNELGVDRANITAKGFGDTQPLYPNSSDENRAKNRRVELVCTPING